MSAAGAARLTREDVEAILAVTRALAQPFDLRTMLAEVAAAACRVLRAERASVWLLDAKHEELHVEVASDLSVIRIPIGVGLVGACARSREVINVPDCYADPRFNPGVDRQTGFRTRCAITLPLIDVEDDLIGVMQVLNHDDGPFDRADEALAEALAAQCAVAIARVRAMETLVERKLIQQELRLASAIQRSTLPAAMPVLDGYAMFCVFEPAAATGGDTFDVALIDQGVLVVLGDATGHGIGPALSVTQMHAMLRMAFMMGADLETAFVRVNDRLAQTLSDGHFVTAFVGLLDPQSHRLRFLSGGQGPILHLRAAAATVDAYRATSFPMGAMPLRELRPAVEVRLEPGDWLVLLSDGIYEYANASGEMFGRARVDEVLLAGRADTVERVAASLMDAVRLHAGGACQEDDITMVLLTRLAAD